MPAGEATQTGDGRLGANVVATEHGDDISAFLTAAATVRGPGGGDRGRDFAPTCGPRCRTSVRQRRGADLRLEVLAGAGRDAAAEAERSPAGSPKSPATPARPAQLAAGVRSSVVVPHEAFAGLDQDTALVASRKAVSHESAVGAEVVTQWRGSRRNWPRRRRPAMTAWRRRPATEAAVEKAAAAVCNASAGTGEGTRGIDDRRR